MGRLDSLKPLGKSLIPGYFYYYICRSSNSKPVLKGLESTLIGTTLEILRTGISAYTGAFTLIGSAIGAGVLVNHFGIDQNSYQNLINPSAGFLAGVSTLATWALMSVWGKHNIDEEWNTTLREKLVEA